MSKGLFRRETTLGWHISLEATIEEAKRRLEWGGADRARIVDENQREVWYAKRNKSINRLRDTNQLAKIIVGIASGEIEEASAKTDDWKKPAARYFCRFRPFA